jgi:hypothetical protein
MLTQLLALKMRPPSECDKHHHIASMHGRRAAPRSSHRESTDDVANGSDKSAAAATCVLHMIRLDCNDSIRMERGPTSEPL